MASMCPPTFQSPRTDSNHLNLNFASSRFASPKFGKRPSQSGVLISRVSDSASCCRCLNRSGGAGAGDSSGSGDSWRWDFGIHEAVSNAIKRIDDYFSSFMDPVVDDGSRVVAGDGGEEEWVWEKWKRHFVEVDEQERVVSILKSQLASAVEREDYDDAARIKVAIAAAATNDTVGRVMSRLKKFVEEERYGEAALIRDNAGAALVGWWAGISEDADDPYGRIICISVEYGRYIARSYSPRQLATASSGAPLFEIYLTDNKKGNFKQQAVYLKRKGSSQDLQLPSFKSSGRSRIVDPRPLDTRDDKSKLFERSSEDTDSEDGDDDVGFNNILRDMIPGMKVKVVKVTAPEKVDMDIISKVIEQIPDEDEEEEDEKDYSLEDVDVDDEIKSENDDDHSDIELDSTDASGVSDEDEQNQIAVELIVGDGFMQKISRGAHKRELLRVPARLEKKGRASFTFTVEEDADEHLSSGAGESLQNKRAKLQTQRTERSIDHVMLDLMKSIGKGKVPTKVLKDVGELINLTISQARNRQPLSGSTTFNRIEISSSSDPLNGLYIGARGLHTSEVIQLKRKFGQWKDEDNSKKPSKIEFYEYVEAVKLTGDAYVPAGQVAFRAKVGKRYQLLHKGIFPEEFGVIARYRGQGRLAEPGFRDPRWVDGELVILDGKYIKGGPVVGFLYWAPEYHFLVFFNRLRLLD